MPRITVFTKAFATWIAMSLGAVANGMLRETVLIPVLGEAVARPLSALLLLVVVYVLTYAFWLWATRPRSPNLLWAIGTMWLVMTIGFEAALGLMRGMTAAEVLALYSPLNPTLWAFVLVGILVAPAVVGRRKGHGFD